MTSAEAQALMTEIRSLKRQLAAISPMSQWPTAAEASDEYGVHRDTLRKLAKAGKLRQSDNLPVRYYRPDLDAHFIGVVAIS